jgi:hypothetical protein
MGDSRGAFRPEDRRPIDRPRCNWEDNIKIALKEVEYGGLD